MLFVFSQSQTFYYSLEPTSHWTVVVLWNRTIQADSGLSEERLITIESNINRVRFKFLQTWCRGWIVFWQFSFAVPLQSNRNQA